MRGASRVVQPSRTVRTLRASEAEAKTMMTLRRDLRGEKERIPEGARVAMMAFSVDSERGVKKVLEGCVM